MKWVIICEDFTGNMPLKQQLGSLNLVLLFCKTILRHQTKNEKHDLEAGDSEVEDLNSLLT